MLCAFERDLMEKLDFCLLNRKENLLTFKNTKPCSHTIIKKIEIIGIKDALIINPQKNA